MTSIRDRSPLGKDTSSNSDQILGLDKETSLRKIEMSVNYSELNIAREIIPTYDGGCTNLSYYIQQCDKFIDTYKVRGPGSDESSFNKLLFELCCSKLLGAARETLIISNCKNWSEVKKALLNRFGDKRNETLLENDLITCYQFSNEIYEHYYERIRSKLQQILEHVNLNEQDENLKKYKTEMYNLRAQNTFCAGLLEPYRSHISTKTVTSLEDALTQLRNYDNHQQQVNFLNFVRQRHLIKPSKIQPQAKPVPRFPQNIPYFSNHQRPVQNFQQSREQTPFPRGPVNIQTRPINNTNFPTNSQVFGKKQEFKPTPMSISTRNTSNFNRNQNHFRQTGPRNFVSEELHNMEEPHSVDYDPNYREENFVPFQQLYYEENTSDAPVDTEDEYQNADFQITASVDSTST